MSRAFKKPSIHNNLVEIIINRVKCMLGYPESRPEMIFPNSVLYRLGWGWWWGVTHSAPLCFALL